VAVTTIAELLVADDPAAWRAAGFTVDERGVCQIGTVRVRLDPSADGTGLVSWTLAGAPDEDVTDVEGLRTSHGDPSPAAPASAHPIGVRCIDHVVVMTPDVERTAATITRRLGLPVKRWRDGQSSGRPVRQAFFRMGEVVLEVVGSPDPDPDAASKPAAFWGLAITIDDLDAAYALLGPDLMGEPKPAVQEGRRITTVRSGAGLGLPVALMDPTPGR